jgi:hypothetical protein
MTYQQQFWLKLIYIRYNLKIDLATSNKLFKITKQSILNTIAAHPKLTSIGIAFAITMAISIGVDSLIDPQYAFAIGQSQSNDQGSQVVSGCC